MTPQTAATTLPALAIAELQQRSLEQAERFHGGRQYEEWHGLELCRRAIVENDDACWRALHELLNAQVVSWCTRAGQGVDADEVAAVAWEKFWISFTPAKLAAARGLAGVLLYLKMCTRSAVIDVYRARNPGTSIERAEINLSDSAPQPADLCTRAVTNAELRRIVSSHLRNERERVFVRLRYTMDRSPAEIAATRPDLFEDATRVYAVARTLLDRLRRSKRLKAWLDEHAS
jgi:hypothetical protein